MSGIIFKVDSGTKYVYKTQETKAYGIDKLEDYLNNNGISGEAVLSRVSSFNNVYKYGDSGPTTEVDPSEEPIYNTQLTIYTNPIDVAGAADVRRVDVYASADVEVKIDGEGVPRIVLKDGAEQYMLTA